ncbi:MAG: hypothetical protein V1824_01165 [archaeon]
MLKRKDTVSLSPSKLVDHFYNDIHFSTSALIVLVVVFLDLLFSLILNVKDIGSLVLYEIFFVFVINWIILGGILYILLYLIKGKSRMPEHAFEKVLSSLASFRIPVIIAYLFLAVISLIFLPSFVGYLRELFTNPALINSLTFSPQVSILNIIGFILIAILVIGLLVYWLMQLYHFTETVYGFKKVWQKLLMMIVIIVISVLFSSIFSKQ